MLLAEDAKLFRQKASQVIECTAPQRRAAPAIMLKCLLLPVLAVAFDDGAPRWFPKYVGGHEATLLDGAWAYGFADALDSVAAGADAVARASTMAVPGTVDAAPPGVPGKRGVSMYETTFETGSQETQWLEFMSCSFFCRAWVDGAEVGNHTAGGYVPFRLAIPPKAGKRTLVVLADNRFNDTTAPLHTGGDFWHYGGLIRSVVLHATTGSAVARAHVFPKFDKAWAVDVDVTLSDASFSGKLKTRLSWDGDDLGEQELTYADGKATTSVAAPKDATLWSIDQPALHELGVSVGGAGVVERFGLRAFTAVDGRIALNGKIVKLHGWNHHTQWPDTGASPTEAQMDEDIMLLKAGGANYVRGAHYPQDQRWLDRLDAAGIVMWEEALGPGVSVENTEDAAWMATQVTQLEEMVYASASHPSIMTWGFFNEGPSTEKKACPAYKTCAETLQRLDSTRFVTWASNKEDRDECLDHATLVSFNGYPAWYVDFGNTSLPGPFWSRLASWVNDEQPGKPFVISETGAGAIYEYDNATAVKWSPKYQLEVLEADVDVALQDELISGITLWHFFDFKGNDGAQTCGPCEYVPDVSPPLCGFINVTCAKGKRPGGANHKGVIDFWRRPKESFAAVAAKYAGV